MSDSLDFERLLKGSDDTLFLDFCGSLGQLMARGLSQLPVDAQVKISEAVARGATLAAVCHCDPASVAGVLTEGDRTVELFRVTEQSAWH